MVSRRRVVDLCGWRWRRSTGREEEVAASEWLRHGENYLLSPAPGAGSVCAAGSVSVSLRTANSQNEQREALSVSASAARTTAVPFGMVTMHVSVQMQVVQCGLSAASFAVRRTFVCGGCVPFQHAKLRFLTLTSEELLSSLSLGGLAS